MRPTKADQLINKDKRLKSKLDQNQPFYQLNLQKAKSKDLSHVDEAGIFKKIHIDHERNIVFEYDPTFYKEEWKQDVELYIIKLIDYYLPKMQNKYCITYLNKSWSNFLVFKSILEAMPEKYFSKLKSVYVIQGDFVIKLIQFFSMSSVSKLVDKLIVYSDNKQECVEMSQRITLQARRSSGKVSQSNSPKAIEFPTKKIKVIKNELYGSKIENYKLHSKKNKVPYLIWLALKKLLITPQMLKKEGIFRKSCNEQQLEILQKQLIKDNMNYIMEITDAYVVAGLIKKIMNNLQQPLFSYVAYGKVLAYSSVDPEYLNTFITEIVNNMPSPNKHTYLLLCCFFKRYICKNEHHNKMSPYNLGVVFGPCFFRPQQYKLEDLINSGKFSKIIMHTIQHLNQLFPEESKELQEILMGAIYEK